MLVIVVLMGRVAAVRYNTFFALQNIVLLMGLSNLNSSKTLLLFDIYDISCYITIVRVNINNIEVKDNII